MRLLLLTLAALHLGLAAWMSLAPGSFAQDVAGYPPQEPHFLGDLATWTAALGAALAIAAWRPSWRTPVLGFAAIQYTLHTLNHIWDAGETDPSGLGPLNAALLGLATAGLAWLALRSRKETR